jgi:hypothetical protein
MQPLSSPRGYGNQGGKRMNDDQSIQSIQVNQATEEASRKLDGIKRALKAQERLTWVIGAAFYDMQQNKLYQTLHYRTWLEFIDAEFCSPEGRLLSRAAIYLYMQLHRIYVLKLQFPQEKLDEVPVDKLRLVASTIDGFRSKETAVELFEKAKTLSRTDLAIEVGMATPEGNFNQKYIKVILCKKCHRYKIPETVKGWCRCDETKA